MESKLFQPPRGQQIDPALLAANQRLSQEERLDAFLTHSRLLMELYEAGRTAREARRSTPV